MPPGARGVRVGGGLLNGTRIVYASWRQPVGLTGCPPCCHTPDGTLCTIGGPFSAPSTSSVNRFVNQGPFFWRPVPDPNLDETGPGVSVSSFPTEQGTFWRHRMKILDEANASAMFPAGLYVTGQVIPVTAQRRRISRWDGNGWLEVAPVAQNSPLGQCYDFEFHNGSMYVIGHPVGLGGNANGIMVRVTSAGQWQTIDPPANFLTFRPRCLLSFGGLLYVGGEYFSFNQSFPFNAFPPYACVMTYNGTSWAYAGAMDLDNDNGYRINVLDFINWNGTLYACGHASGSTTGQNSALIRREGSNWVRPYSGPIQSAQNFNALGIWNDLLYIGGPFTQMIPAPTATARGLMSFDGETFNHVGLNGNFSGLPSTTINSIPVNRCATGFAIHEGSLHIASIAFTGPTTFAQEYGHAYKWDGATITQLPDPGEESLGYARTQIASVPGL